MSQIQAFDFSVDIMKTLLWEHDKAERLKTLIALKQQWYNKNYSAFWSDWVRDVFNLDTANEFGLSVHARIVDLPLFIEQAPQVGKVAFGFGAGNANFENGNFSNITSTNVPLNTEQRRLALKLRWHQLTSRPTVPQTNRMLVDLFADYGKVYVVDSYDMSPITYVFQMAPSAELKFIFDNFDLLPRPATVGVRYITQPLNAFGFSEAHLNFQNGAFGA